MTSAYEKAVWARARRASRSKGGEQGQLCGGVGPTSWPYTVPLQPGWLWPASSEKCSGEEF